LGSDAGGEGWIRLYRKSFEDDYWNEPGPKSKWEARVDLIRMAAHAPHEHQGVDLERGDFCASERFLAKRWMRLHID